MKRYFSSIFVLFVLFYSGMAFADTAAFTYFENRAKNPEYEFLSTVLPNSLASTLSAEFDIDTFKPADIEALLKKNEQDALKKNYTDLEMPKLLSAIGKPDYFLSGYFQAVDDYNIEVGISIYDSRTHEIFSFSSTGKFSPVGATSTEVFNLVDRLTDTFSGFITQNQRYQEIDIPDNAKLAFITNLDAESLNRFYGPFLEKGFGVIALQSNEIENHLIGDILLSRIKYIGVKKNLFDIARKNDQTMYSYSPARGKASLMYQERTKDLIKKYYYSYPDQQLTTLKNLNNACRNKIDYLFVAVFDEKYSEVMIRCFDLKRFDARLVWLQTGIRGEGKDSDKTADIAQSLLRRFNRNESSQKQK